MLRRLLQRIRSGPPPALATVYLREGRLLVQPSDRTVMRTAGFWVGATPVVSLTETDDPASVGQAVLDALARSRVEVPVPERDAQPDAPLRSAAGVRSWRAFASGTRACWVRREDHTIIVTPLHNGGSTGDDRGFSPLGETETIQIDPTPTAEAVGRAVLAGLQRAT